MDSFVFKAYAKARELGELDDMLVGAFEKIWPFFGFALLGMFVYGGVMWMMSSGDPQKLQKATNTFLWAFVGTVIFALIFVITGMFEDIFGLKTGFEIGTFDI